VTSPIADRQLVVPGIRIRRALFSALVLGTTAAAATMMFGIVGAGGVTGLEVAILVLFVPTFGWITVAFWNAIVGFVLGVLGRDALSLQRLGTASRSGAAEVPLTTRTALVMPAHNERPELVMGGLSAIMHSLEDTGYAENFDFHLLSDTTDIELAHREEGAWRALRDGATRPHRLHYRRRGQNAGRKAGNIAEFCTRCSDDYDFVVVLDADSVMSGDTVVELVRVMEANPTAGLVQTVPLPARQHTLFGRFIQFAAALYSPMLASGQSFWQGDAANYWGHNAIIRLAPFAEHGRLPVLKGRPPLGGPVLSHDFVEAALLRRAGWGVYLLPGLGGSWEDVPGNVVDFAQRDRRWAQGSIQHLRLLGLHGLHPVSRVHFMLGAMGYLSSVLWMLILLAGTAYVLVPALSSRSLFPAPGGSGEIFAALFGIASAFGGLAPLLAVTAIVLFGPKVLGLTLAVGRRRAAFGGGPRLVVGALLETVFSVIVAPVMMLYHARFVFGILTGHDVVWGAQPRDGRAVGWSEAVRSTAGMTLVGIVWAGVTLLLSPAFFLWLTPIFAGILLAAPLVRLSSRPLGRRLETGLLVTPADVLRPTELFDPRATEAAGRRRRTSHMFLTQQDPDVKRRISSMYEAERGLFDLQRGRAVLVTPPDGEAGTRPVLVAAVEGLTEETISRLTALGCGPLHLTITGHRAAAMGLTEDPGTTMGSAFALRLDDENATDILRIATSPAVADFKALRVREATIGERAGLTLMRLGRMLPATLAVETDLDSVPRLATAISSGETLTVCVDQVSVLAGTSDESVEVTYVSDAPVPLEEAENVRFMLFREANALTEHVAILIGEPEQWPDPVPVRLHSACLTGDLFGSLRCDCGEQLRRSLQVFSASGGGVLLYLEQEGRGIGLGNKLRAYSLQQEGLDTVDADCVLGFGADERRYHGAVGILRHLGIERVRLLTNNPEKLQALEDGGIRVVDRTPLHGTLNRHNLPYVRAKVQRAGHWLGDMLHGGISGD
jgi:membrane glycosyltransferase